MTGGKRLRIAALFVIVLVFAFIMDMSSNAITDNTLIRNDTGDGDTVYDLVLNADGFDEDYSYQLKVREEQPSEKQANELFTQAKKEIDDSFCEENQSVEQVRGHVIMKDAYASGAVEAEWTLSDYDVVDINGDVNQDAFEEADDEQGKLISASVELSCGEHRQLYDFSFVVFPDELDAGERLIKGINRHIDSEMSKTGTKKLTLPDEMMNHHVLLIYMHVHFYLKHLSILQLNILNVLYLILFQILLPLMLVILTLLKQHMTLSLLGYLQL